MRATNGLVVAPRRVGAVSPIGDGYLARLFSGCSTINRIIRFAHANRSEANRTPHRPSPQLPPLDRRVDTGVGLRVGSFEVVFHKIAFKYLMLGK